ncbi:DUF1064 domain-containing protein [Kallipyga gabonensis]|uniref:DUF1064 domain-containing protein n=1 Tax=Kallipyga gabonensis TaxID=1686287 RepID=UPI0006B4F11F|nr:DUF1064 domain-containing protein [Kallipyga gabonensis]
MRRYSKYNAKRTKVLGHTFDSKAEANRFLYLKALEQKGEILDLELQPRFPLLDSYVNGEGKRIRPISYVADFRYKDAESGEVVIEDVKGRETDVYRLKKKLFENKYNPLTIREVR